MVMGFIRRYMINKTILVVDDDPLMINVVRYMLLRNGFKVLEAANGQEALDVMKEHEQKTDLIITDYNMPKMNGLELAKSVKIDQKHQNTLLILMTSNTKIILTSSEPYNIFNEIIHKPFSSELILNKVTALLGK